MGPTTILFLSFTVSILLASPLNMLSIRIFACAFFLSAVTVLAGSEKGGCGKGKKSAHRWGKYRKHHKGEYKGWRSDKGPQREAQSSPEDQQVDVSPNASPVEDITTMNIDTSPTTTQRIVTVISSSSLSTAAPANTQDSIPSQSGLSQFASDALQAHNAERAKRNAAPLTWSEELAAAAKTWTDKCVFEHGGGKPLGAGENLAAGFSTITSAIQAWNDEAKDYTPGSYSHWTQVVWKGTTQVGCAMTQCDNIGAFSACEYLEHGNVIGQFDDNVEL